MTGQKFAEGRTDKKQIWQHGSYEEMKKVSLCFVCCGFRPPSPALAHQPGLSDGWRRHELNLHISCSKQSCTRTLDCLHSRYPGRVTAVGSSNVAPAVRCQTHGFQDSSKVLKVKHIRGITSPSPARYPLLGGLLICWVLAPLRLPDSRFLFVDAADLRNEFSPLVCPLSVAISRAERAVSITHPPASRIQRVTLSNNTAPIFELTTKNVVIFR